MASKKSEPLGTLKILVLLGTGIMLVILTFIVGLPFIMDRENVSLDVAKILDQPRRPTLAFLRDGFVHYELSGPVSERPPVVLIHGVSGPMMVWDSVVEPLIQAGHRVLRFDLYGRGLSQRVNRTYDLELYLSQLGELLAATGLAQKQVDLVGSSMGAIIASEYATRQADQVRKLVLVGPAGFPLQASPLAQMTNLPGLGDYIMKSFGDRSLTQHHRRYFVHPEKFESYHQRFAEQLRAQGSKRAILSTLRSTPLQKYLPGYEKLGAVMKAANKEVLLIWGEKDHAFPYENHRAALAAIPTARLVTIPEAGHLPQLERAEIVVPELLRVLK